MNVETFFKTLYLSNLHKEFSEATHDVLSQDYSEYTVVELIDVLDEAMAIFPAWEDAKASVKKSV